MSPNANGRSFARNALLSAAVLALVAVPSLSQTVAPASGSDKNKNVQVRMVVSAAVPRKLLPEKKGVGAF